MRRVYLKLYIALVISVLASLSVTSMALLVIWQPSSSRAHSVRTALEDLITRIDGANRETLEQAIREFGKEEDADIAVWDADGVLLTFSGDTPPRSLPSFSFRVMDGKEKKHHSEGAKHLPPPMIRPHPKAMPSFFPLTDGRLVGVVVKDRPRLASFIVRSNVVLFLLLAIACLPIARWFTRPVETLKMGVEKWSHGDLRARLPVEGRDEIAAVAEEFNKAADRIEELLVQQRRMMASASHELRSPLTRVRMALELLRGKEGQDDFRDRAFVGAARDIDELDTLIGDLLLAARAESIEQGVPKVQVSLLPLLESEAERMGVQASGDNLSVSGDRQMLRRMFRNLLENAAKHAGTEGLEAVMKQEGDRARIEVRDRGPGIPDEEKERIFEPFYRPAHHREGRDGGVGLGLGLVRQIAAFHGGTATCVDREGGGTSFVIELPGITGDPTAPPGE